MYCNVEDVKLEFKQLDIASAADDSTALTIEQVETIIGQESNFIDSYLCSKYVMPIVEGDSPKAFDLLKRICTFRVADRLRNILDIKTGDPALNQDVKGEIRTPISDLNRILDGRLRLQDAVLMTPDSGIAFGTIASRSCKAITPNNTGW